MPELTLKPPQRHLSALTGLRFIAAFMVLMFHQTYPSAWLGGSFNGNPPGWVRVLSYGDMSVSLFFVLSGFVLAHSYLANDRHDWKAFWAARVARIYPVYLLAWFTALIIVIGKTRAGLMDPSESILAGSLSILLVQAWDEPHALSWNVPAWSLSAECFFYLVFPWLGTWVWRASRRSPLALIAILYGLGIGMFALAGALSSTGRPSTFNPLLRLPEFLIGICAYRYLLAANSGTPWPRWAPDMLILVSLAGLVSCHWAVGTPLAGYRHMGLCAPAFAGLVLGLAMSRSRACTWLGSAPMVLLGESSYALYILHMMVLTYLFHIDHWLGLAEHHPHAMVLIYAALTVAISILVFTCFERPLRWRVRDWLAPAAPRAVVDTPMSPLLSGRPPNT